jgi:3-oxoacyl-(acyl-carrier-protein) synthase
VESVSCKGGSDAIPGHRLEDENPSYGRTSRLTSGYVEGDADGAVLLVATEGALAHGQPIHAHLARR